MKRKREEKKLLYLILKVVILPRQEGKKSRPIKVDYKRVNVSRAGASKRVRRGAKIVESECSD
jgi:hypothetical protein